MVQKRSQNPYKPVMHFNCSNSITWLTVMCKKKKTDAQNTFIRHHGEMLQKQFWHVVLVQGQRQGILVNEAASERGI